jgi:hypothetical protein
MIVEHIRPFAPAVELLCTVVGIQHRGAECIIGEIGTDMSCFATARHLASWAGRCPGNDKPAGKRRSGKTRDGSKWLDFALEEAVMAAIRVKGHYRPRGAPSGAGPKPKCWLGRGCTAPMIGQPRPASPTGARPARGSCSPRPNRHQHDAETRTSSTAATTATSSAPSHTRLTPRAN